MARNPLQIRLELERIRCHDEGDGWGSAEPIYGPYLSRSTATPWCSDNVVIPSAIGDFTTTLRPIPVGPAKGLGKPIE